MIRWESMGEGVVAVVALVAVRVSRVLAPMVKPSWVQCESVQGSGFGCGDETPTSIA